MYVFYMVYLQNVLNITQEVSLELEVMVLMMLQEEMVG